MASIAGVNLTFISNLPNLSSNEADSILHEVNSLWGSRFSFPELTAEHKGTLSTNLIDRLNSPDQLMSCHLSCLQILKLLSRDKADMDSFVTENLAFCLLRHAKYVTPMDEIADVVLVVEAQKCVCNFAFQSDKFRRFCCSSDTLANLCRRIRKHADGNENLTFDINFYDLRLLFLLTALCPDVRSTCRNEPCNLHMALFKILQKSAEETSPLTNQQVDLISETLKGAFNILLSFKFSQLEPVELECFLQLTGVLRKFLLHQTHTKEKCEEIKTNTVNLLTSIPSICYPNLAPSINLAELSTARISGSIYEGYDLSAVDVLLDFLYERLDRPTSEQTESLSPILTLLTQIACTCKTIRKYMRYRVLPPLRDVTHRPEEGLTLRNKLVKLMTSVTDVKDLAAEFLFQLCKCNVDRMIKYTGFGNAAGLLSNYGLLAGASKAQIHSDDENSDTEEYLNMRNQINPVLGCYEPPKPDPMEGMSDERKEYEAMKLMGQINKLLNAGVVVPARVGEDGKVHPIEHILELQHQNQHHEQEDDED